MTDYGRRLPLWARAGNVPFVAAIRLYRVTLSPLIGGQCRFEPTCSRYGLDAYRLYGPVRGTRLTLTRILRCHPFSKGGYDPVPIPDDTDDTDGPEGDGERNRGYADDVTQCWADRGSQSGGVRGQARGKERGD